MVLARHPQVASTYDLQTWRTLDRGRCATCAVPAAVGASGCPAASTSPAEGVAAPAVASRRGGSAGIIVSSSSSSRSPTCRWPRRDRRRRPADGPISSTLQENCRTARTRTRARTAASWLCQQHPGLRTTARRSWAARISSRQTTLSPIRRHTAVAPRLPRPGLLLPGRQIRLPRPGFSMCSSSSTAAHRRRSPGVCRGPRIRPPHPDLWRHRARAGRHDRPPRRRASGSSCRADCYGRRLGRERRQHGIHRAATESEIASALESARAPPVGDDRIQAQWVAASTPNRGRTAPPTSARRGSRPATSRPTRALRHLQRASRRAAPASSERSGPT